MQIKTWSNFKKDKNSTKIPIDSEATIYNITLKENTSLINPTFILRWDNVPDFNYLQYILSFYYVDDYIMRSKDVYEVRCSLDPLATYRNDILSSNQFVLRSSSDYNIFLADSDVTPALNQIKEVWDINIPQLAGGTYIVKVLGRGTVASIDGICVYIMSKEQVNQFVRKCFEQPVYASQIQSIEDFGELFKCALYNPSSNILSIHWIPYNVPGGSGENVFVGNFDTGIQAQSLGASGASIITSITAPTAKFNDWRDFDDRFTKFELSIPCVGVVPINPADAYAGITTNINIEYLTGSMIIYLFNSQTNAIISKFSTCVNANIQIGGRTGESFANSLTTALSSAGQIMANSPSMSYGQGANAIGGGLQILHNAFQPSYSSIGSQGSRIDIERDHTFRLTRRTFGSSDYVTNNDGRPLQAYRQLSNLSGFCRCLNAKINTSAYGTVKDMILDYMNGGFFIE